MPVETKQDQNLDCLSIQPGIPDMWCATRCVANGDCPPDTCKCGEGAREQGAAARAEAAKAWEDAENKRRADAEQKIDDPDKKYTDEPWKGNQQAAQAMDNWKEAEARVKSASAGTAYPDGLPPADEDIKEHEEDSFENAEDIPMDKSCVSVGSFKYPHGKSRDVPQWANPCEVVLHNQSRRFIGGLGATPTVLEALGASFGLVEAAGAASPIAPAFL